jgi:hypothetical protein
MGQPAWGEPFVVGMALLEALFLVYVAVENLRVRGAELADEDLCPWSSRRMR